MELSALERQKYSHRLKFYMRSNFGQIFLLTTELATIERLKSMSPLFSVAIDLIVGNENMHNFSCKLNLRLNRMGKWCLQFFVVLFYPRSF